MNLFELSKFSRKPKKIRVEGRRAFGIKNKHWDEPCGRLSVEIIIESLRADKRCIFSKFANIRMEKKMTFKGQKIDLAQFLLLPFVKSIMAAFIRQKDVEDATN